jgi:SAM-dependent methyltransferase
MGIDIHALNFVRYASKKKLLGDTVTIGRQGLHVIEPVVRQTLSVRADYHHQEYSEQVLTEYLGAKSVVSVDNSRYEGATHVHDMNYELPQELWKRFDTVIDGGCVEHVFNVSQALRNCSLFLKPGGQVIHILPANNFCGHGFWQCSPELFFSLYSSANGYKDTEIFIADLADPQRWHRVARPVNGGRANVSSRTPLYVLVRSVVETEVFSHQRVQQSDYVHAWEGAGGSGRAADTPPPTGLLHKLKTYIRRNRTAHRVASSIHQRLAARGTGLRSNPSLTTVDVERTIESS